MLKKIVPIITVLFVIFIRIPYVFANESTSSTSIETLTGRIDELATLQSQNVAAAAENAIDSANLVIAVTGLIFTIAAILGSILAIIFQNRIKDLEEDAQRSASEMKILVGEGRSLEQAFVERKREMDNMTIEVDKMYKALQEKMEALREDETNGEKESKLLDLKNEISDLKKEMYSMQQYTTPLGIATTPTVGYSPFSTESAKSALEGPTSPSICARCGKESEEANILTSEGYLCKECWKRVIKGYE